MFKKFIAVFLISTMVLSSIPAFSGIDDAFNSLVPSGAVSVNQPGKYSSGARSSVIAGGIGIRVPRPAANPSLFSVSPPSIQAGCNGISAHFGGFSFISGAEFEQMLKSIASGAALGFVSHLSLKTLCPSCEAIVQFMKSAAQQAARLSKDSCQWGRELADKFKDKETGRVPLQDVCGAQLATSGANKDIIEAMANGCKSMKSAVDSLLGEVAPDSSSKKGKLEALSASCQAGIGNFTWARLGSMYGTTTSNTTSSSSRPGFYDDPTLTKQIIMNLMGVELGVGSGNSVASCKYADGHEEKSNPDTGDIVYCTPRMSPDVLMGLFMCGAPGTGSKSTSITGLESESKYVTDYCKLYFRTGASEDSSYNDTRQTAWACADKDFDSCSRVVEVDSSEVFSSGTGFLPQVHNLLLKGVASVKDNKPIDSEVLNLIQIAPYPLYQAINLAAIYPAAAGDLLSSMSTLIAEQMAYSYFDELVKTSGRASDGTQCLTSKSANQLFTLISEARARAGDRTKLIAQNLQLQEGLTEQIRILNLSVQKQVMTQDLLVNSQMSDAINTSITQGSSSEAGSSDQLTSP